MKIGIFGDSYGEAANRECNKKSNSWINHLANINNNELDVINHCLSSTSLYYSIKLFLKYHRNYDKIIFLVTSQQRIEIGNHFVDSMKSEHLATNLSGYFETQTILSKDHLRHEFDDKVYRAAADYFIYIQNLDSDNFKHQLMVEKIKSIRPDVLAIQCFPGTIAGEKFFLKMISDIDINHYKKAWETVNIEDCRHCHMNDENNIIFAEKIYNWIKTNDISLNISDFVAPKDPPEYYGF